MLRLRPLGTGAGATGRALDAAQAAVGRAHARGALPGEREPVFHGLLTDWESIPHQERAELIAEFELFGIYGEVAPESLAHVLAAYDDAPGRWLIQPLLDKGLEPELVKAEEHLWETYRVGGDSHQELATDAMFVWLRALILTRRIHFDANPAFDLLARYEERLTESERSIAQSTLRAAFLSFQAADPADQSRSVDWCRRFWKANGTLFKCMSTARDDPEATDADRLARGSARIYRLHYRFLRCTADLDPDPWDHDRLDVLTGVVWRILRLASHLITHPALWSEEHGYPSVRMMFEGYIQLKWMLQVETVRPDVWQEFKDYGRGRTKALYLHTQEVLGRASGEPRELLERLLPRLREQANRDKSEEFQEISTASTFASDKSLLDMATEVGLRDMYQSTMIPASSALHGDWSALEDLVLDRCEHALHDRHVLPRPAYAGESTEQFPYLAESFAQWSFLEFVRAVGREPISDEEANEEMRAQAVDADMAGSDPS
jgi:hypothetical protein